MDEPVITTTLIDIDVPTSQSASEVTTPSSEAAPTGELNETQSIVVTDTEIINRLDQIILIEKSTYTLIMISIAVICGVKLLWSFLRHIFR